jgi:lipopolysaccharide transport system permease protein
MDVVATPRGRGVRTLEFSPGHTFAERRRMAARDLREAAGLWRLCCSLAWLDIKLRYRGSILGPFWLTLSTGVMVAAMGVTYATLFRLGLREYLPFLAVSQVLWGFLAMLMSDACNAYVESEGMIRAVRMPFTLYAARIVLRSLIILAHNTLVFVVLYVVLRIWPGAPMLLAVPALLVWMIDGLALTVLVGALCARFRDVPPIVANLTQMAFFITPVIWKPELIGEKQWLLVFNPFYDLLEIVRGPLLGTVPGIQVYVAALLYSLVLCALAWLGFVRVRGRIAFWV